MIKRLLSVLPLAGILAAISLVTFSGVRLAAAAVAATSDPDSSSAYELVKAVYDAFHAGYAGLAGALALVALVALTKRYLAPRVAFLRTDAGLALLMLAGSAGLAAASTLGVPGATVSWSLIKSAFLTGLGVAGGVVVLIHLVVQPILVPLAAKAPAWAKPIFDLVFFLLDQATPSQVTIGKATEAGDAAVAAAPAGGVTAVTGNPTEIK